MWMFDYSGVDVYLVAPEVVVDLLEPHNRF